jgi:hypothetical protein
MRAIGFRCFTDSISFVVLEGLQSSPQAIASECRSFPKGLKDFEYLSWVRKEVIEILNKYGAIESASVKIAERNTRKPHLGRAEVEGVLKEVLFTQANIKCVSRIKSQLKRDIGFEDSAKYVARVLPQIGLADLDKPNFQEATLACIAALPII